MRNLSILVVLLLSSLLAGCLESTPVTYSSSSSPQDRALANCKREARAIAMSDYNQRRAAQQQRAASYGGGLLGGVAAGQIMGPMVRQSDIDLCMSANGYSRN